MTLGRFATIVGAPGKWVQNARTALGLSRHRYSEDEARRLGLAREVSTATGMDLKRAWAMAGSALAAWPEKKAWEWEAPEASVRIVIDLERYLSSYAMRLSLSREWYAEKQRGRPRKRVRDPIAAA